MHAEDAINAMLKENFEDKFQWIRFFGYSVRYAMHAKDAIHAMLKENMLNTHTNHAEKKNRGESFPERNFYLLQFFFSRKAQTFFVFSLKLCSFFASSLFLKTI